MSATRSRTRRSLRGAVALALGAQGTVLLPVGAATAAKPAPAPVYGIATHIEFDDISTPTIHLPGAPGAVGLIYVVKGIAFQAHLTFLDDAGAAMPLSTNKTVTVTVSDGTTFLGSTDVDPGTSEATVSLLAIGAAASGVKLTASAATKPRPVTGTSDAFDVLIESEQINADGASAIGGENGTDTECNATPDYPTCADLIPPVTGSFGDDGLLSRGLCSAVDPCPDSYVQALTTLDGADRFDPATLIMKCDKSLCGGGAIKSKRLSVTLTPTSGTLEAPDCPAKNTVGEYDPSQPLSATNAPFCVDYVQSTRDNAGDTYLYLLFTQDAKVRFS
jgi:hypothetical protein